MRRAYWVLLGAALVASAVLAICVGTIAIGPGELIGVIRGRGSDVATAVVETLRLPRVLLAVLVGAGLGMSGGALQGAMRNPLAEPYLLGVSGGAAVGAVLATMLGLPAGLVPVAAFAGAVLAVVAAFFVAHATGTRGDARVLLMAGVVVGAFANAASMVALANAESNTIRGALWWMSTRR